MTNRQAAIKVIKQLRSNGFHALFAGGCVRDMLLGRRAKDYDVATDAEPKEVMKLFRRTLKIGAKFGVVIALLENQRVEVVTFRTDIGYTDGRHPSSVKFAKPREDAARRDFTVNGMFYDPVKKQVIDYVNGQADLKKKSIRTIGAPNERFKEDYLRLLRAVRFATQLGFAIEPRTWSAICSGSKNIAKISAERIAMELEAILVNPQRSTGAKLLASSGLAKAIFPEITDGQFKLAINVLGQLRKKIDFALGLAGLFVGLESKVAFEAIRGLKLSNSQIKHIKFLLDNRDNLLNTNMSLAQLKMTLAKPYFWDLYEFQRAIQKAHSRPLTALVNLRKRIKALGDTELKPKPLLNGHNLIRLGAVPGPGLGQLAEEMYIAQLEGKLQTVQQARQWVKTWLLKHKAIET